MVNPTQSKLPLPAFLTQLIAAGKVMPGEPLLKVMVAVTAVSLPVDPPHNPLEEVWLIVMLAILSDESSTPLSVPLGLLVYSAIAPRVNLAVRAD